MFLLRRLALTCAVTSVRIGKRETRKTFEPRFATRSAMYKFTPDISDTTRISVETERMIPISIRNDRSLCSHKVASATAIGSRRLIRDFFISGARHRSEASPSFYLIRTRFAFCFDRITIIPASIDGSRRTSSRRFFRIGAGRSGVSMVSIMWRGYVIPGKVYLIGAGPGDPELLTLKAARLLRVADAILHDDLVPLEILALAPAGARVQNVGKRCGKESISQSEIERRLVEYARQGLAVVRLKGGDPLIFGRAGEEMDALTRAGIEFEIVPGVTAALGAAA